MTLANLSLVSAAPKLTPYSYQTAKNTTLYPPTSIGGTASPDYGSIVSAIPKTQAGAPAVSAPTGAPQVGADYQAQLASDQTLQQALKAINDQSTANAAALTASRQRAVVDYGAVPASLGNPALTGDANADIDQQTRDLAAEATKGGVSTVARLQHAYDLTRQGHLNSLAARGMLRSGALGQHEGEDLLGYQQANYTAGQSLLDYLTGSYQNYLGLQSQGQQRASDATNAALQRIIAQINAGLSAARAQASASAAPSGGSSSSALQAQLDSAATSPDGSENFVAPEYGPYAGYVPTGTVTAPQVISAPGGGTYRSGGGSVSYQSNTGKYGKKPLY